MLSKLLVAVGLVVCLAACVSFMVGPPSASPSMSGGDANPQPVVAQDRYFGNGNLIVWWDREQLPGKPTQRLTKQPHSNIHPQDYVGAEACQKCHKENYASWAQHPHRWMNALATDETVQGDFSGVSIAYLGGRATFLRTDEGGFQMEFERDRVRRVYAVTQTIGSRFFQYYVGHLRQGPELPDHPAYHTDHVMLFGYWLDRHEWVPAVHVGHDEAPDGQREDPFAKHLPAAPLSPYFQCNSCHTTFALGDELTRNFWSLGRHPPYALHWNMPEYLAEHRADLMANKSPRAFPNTEVEQLLMGMQQFDAPSHAMGLGVSCEACHLGCKAHAEGQQEKPSFVPVSPHLRAETDAMPTGREHQNINWACGRCHAGERPYYAGGMATWNSTEYTDATKGGCYSQLTCVGCHNPHQTIGKQWTRTAQQDDESCLRCHVQLRESDALTAHTHHGADSQGSRCMNCHMPRITEGLQDVIRTHTIFSPTNAPLIEANGLNACNICHVEKPIDWTLTHLKSWYGASFAEAKIAANYPLRDQPTVVGWLKSDREAVRLAATDAMRRSQDRTALTAWLNVLDDPYLLNRQFARVSVEDRFQIRLEDFGYRFYLTPDERRQPIERIRQHLESNVDE